MKFRLLILGMLAITLLLFSAGCSLSDKASQLKDDVVNITMDQVAFQLENSLNQELPALQVDTPDILNAQGAVDWESFKQTELANYVFYSFGDYEFRAVLVADGKFKIERINYSTGDTYSYAEFDVEFKDGKFDVRAK